MLLLGWLRGGSQVFDVVFLILVDKCLLLLLSIPDINRNSAVHAEVLLEKRGCLFSLFQPLLQVLTSLSIPGKDRSGLRQDCCLLSSLAQGHLVSASSQPFFTRWSFLLTVTLSLGSRQPLEGGPISHIVGLLSTGTAWKRFLLDCRGFLLQTLDVGFRASIKPQNIFSFSYCFLPPHGLPPLHFQSGCLVRDKNKALSLQTAV